MDLIEVDGFQYKIYNVPGDGNCMFYALSKCLFGDVSHAVDVRLRVVDYVCEHWEELQCTTSTTNGVPFPNAIEYRRVMSLSGTYGDAAELSAAAAVYRADIRVIEDRGTVTARFQADLNNQTDELTAVHLYFWRRNLHYGALLITGNPSSDEFSSQSPTEWEKATRSENSGPSASGACFPTPPSSQEDSLDQQVDMATKIRIGAEGNRRCSVQKLSALVTGRHSLEMPHGVLGPYYMWACMFVDEVQEDIQQISMGDFTSVCANSDCGALYWQAEHLAPPRSSELPFWCCGKQTRTLLSKRALFSPIRDAFIRELYYGDTPDAVHFRKNIRSYNAVLSTAMPSVAYDKSRRCKKTVIVNGAICFNAPSCPNIEDSGLPAHHGQLYFLNITDVSLEKRIRAASNANIRRDILRALEVYLRSHNDLVRTFEFAGKIQERIERQEGEESTLRVAVVVNPHRNGMRGTERELFIDEAEDLMRPDRSECVAAVIVGTEVRYSYDMLFHPRARTESDPLYMKVHVASPTLDMMLYPLIHLHAEDPWTERVVPDNRKRKRDADPVKPANQIQDSAKLEMGSLREYYSSRIMIRPGQDILFRCTGLFQQYLVDAALKIMDSNLHYIEEHQDELQVCQYDSLQRYVESLAAKHDKQPGRVVILPRCEQRSERSMYNYYMDSVRIAMEYGAPSLFITFTVNPRWPEIVQGLRSRNLQPGEYMHAPDIVVRVFLARLNVFLSDVIHKSVLGRVKAYVGVTEFTSTMLPHYHLAVMLHSVDHPESDSDVNGILSAEIPDREEDSEGHALVMGLMIHRPCDGSSPGYTNMTCRPDGPNSSCKHGFPKPFQPFTTVSRRGCYPRRRKTAAVWSSKFKCMVDNRWVVEHNLPLLKRHNNHINIRLCAQNIFFKYLFSYMQKEANGQHIQGSTLRYSLENSTDVLNWDEPEAFRKMRIIGVYEAVFRILGRSFVEMSHRVESLPIHLPGKQHVYYRGDARRAATFAENSKLMAFFELCLKSEFAATLLYQDIISHYKWEEGMWKAYNVSVSALGRLMHVNPSNRNKELYHLRLLLLHVRGPTSFKDLLTFDGITYEYFSDACEARRLAAQDFPCHDEAMDEVVNHASPWQIRNFFANLVVNCSLGKIGEVWRKHRLAMADDFRQRGAQYVLLKARSAVLRQIQDMDPGCCIMAATELTVPGENCGEEVIPLEAEAATDVEENDLLHCASSSLSEVEAHLQTLTPEQRLVHTSVMQAVTSPQSQRSNIFSLMAPAGTGKTHVYRGIINECTARGIPYVATAFTAIAALLLPAGETCHKAFGIPIRGRTDGNERSFIEASSENGVRLSAVRLIVIDECSMISCWQLKLIDHLFRMLRGTSHVPFGGCTVLLGGDMAQILPVRKGAGDVTDQCVLSWEHWHERHPFTLSRNMRAAQDPAFADWVSGVRDGSANFMGTNSIIIPDCLLVTPQRNPEAKAYKTAKNGNKREEEELMDGTIQRVFSDLSQARLESGVILTPTNKVVRDLNNRIIEKLPGAEKVYFGTTTIFYQDSDRSEGDFIITQEELNSINASNLPPYELKLKIGCVVMLLINMNKRQGMCNGTRFVVTQLNSHTIGVRMLNPFNGEKFEVFLPRMRMRSDEIPVAGTVERCQFPICLSFAMTVNKSQGQSMDYVGLFLLKPVFCHGQFYVAVSRGRRGDRVCVAILKGSQQGPKNLRATRVGKNSIFTKNIVIKELLM